MKLQLYIPVMILPFALFTSGRLSAQSAPAPAPVHEHKATAAGKATPAATPKFRGKGDGITTCPASGDPIDPKLFAVINGRKIFFCCEECVDMVKKNPALYLKADSGVAVDAPAAAKPAAPAAASEPKCGDKPAEVNSLVPAPEGCVAPEPVKKTGAATASQPPTAN